MVRRILRLRLAEAAPAIRSILSSPVTFIGMVRQGCAAIDRNRRFDLGSDETLPDGSLAQGVRTTTGTPTGRRSPPWKAGRTGHGGSPAAACARSTG